MRVGPRGSGEFKEMEWEEALRTATTWLSQVRATDPKKLALFTGRDQSQALTGWWATQFGTPNFAAHGGFCSVNMAAAGLYTFGGAFWEFGEPDWDNTKYFMLFGVAEDHASNPIKIGLGKLKKRGAKVVSINPVRTGYSPLPTSGSASARHRRAVRRRADPRAVEGRQDRPRLSRSATPTRPPGDRRSKGGEMTG
jgi:anaerobic selenocysteine-containing dehydrogenase